MEAAGNSSSMVKAFAYEVSATLWTMSGLSRQPLSPSVGIEDGVWVKYGLVMHGVLDVGGGIIQHA